MTKLPTLRSKSFSVSVKTKGKPHKIFQIVFQSGKKSGNTYIFVNFPYFSKTKGLLSRVVFPANDRTAKSLSLIPDGKVTTHLIKFNHPLDGNSHFSADGKILTKIRNQSSRLDNSIGHLFTIQIQNPEAFRLREDKKLNSERTDVEFNFNESEGPEALKFIGWWFKATDLKGVINPNLPLEPKFGFRDPDGKIREIGFVISPPEDNPLNEYALLISCQPMQRIDKKRKSLFSFIGGFDKEKNLESDLHFLACIYPTENYNKFLKTIGSVDFDLGMLKSR